MKRITKITVLALGLAGLVPGFRPSAGLFQAAAQTTGEQEVVPEHHKKVLTFDVAVDCRTITGSPNAKRGEVWVLNAKIFPAGTLPVGTARNDPTQPVNGVAPIGDSFTRGQRALPFPPAIAPSYGSQPFDFATVYHMFNNGRTALIAEGYNFVPSGEFLASMIGGIGAFRGVAGDLRGTIIGTNITGCPNFRTRINLVRGGSNN